MKAAAGDSMFDGFPAEPKREQLASGDHTMLLPY